jgi:peptide/nickel transport system substrate-binding protein
MFRAAVVLDNVNVRPDNCVACIVSHAKREWGVRMGSSRNSGLKHLVTSTTTTPAGRALGRCTRWFIAAGLVLSVQTAVSSGAAEAASSGGGVLTTSYPFSNGAGTPVLFDPAQFTAVSCCFDYTWPVYGGLLRETASGAYVPDLATSVTIPNPSTLDVVLRPGLVYSNGQPLNAAAVKAGYERNLANPNTGAWDAPMYTISSIAVTGNDSLVLHFSKPDAAAFYPSLADAESFMALPTGPNNGPPNTNVVGAGPFMIQSYTPDSKLVLVKNPRYWDAKNIALSGVTILNVPSGPQQINALRSGLVDVEGIPSSDFGIIKTLTSFQTYSAIPDANYFYVPICKSSGPLASVKVRQALNYAVNRVAINQALLDGLGQPAWSLFPAASVFYDKSLTNIYAYNLQKAKTLLTQAGYPHGFSTSIMAEGLDPTDQLATVLQAEWAQIGVKVSIVGTSNYVTDLYVDHKAPMGINPTGLPGVQKLTTMYIPGGSIGDLCDYDNPTLNSLTNEIESLPPNSPKLRTAWLQAQDIVIKNALGIYIDYSPNVTAATKNVKNLQEVPVAGGELNYWAVSLQG